jgi:hypothetical protein
MYRVIAYNVVLHISGPIPLTPKLNPSAQRCLTIFLLGILLLEPSISINTCVKNQQMQQLFMQFISYVW